jgi:hypothetical protein
MLRRKESTWELVRTAQFQSLCLPGGSEEKGTELVRKITKYRVYLLSCTRRTAAVKQCPEDAGFLCDKNNVLRVLTKRTLRSTVTVNKGKAKAVPLQAWSGPEGSRKLRFPVFRFIIPVVFYANEGG